MREIWWLDAGTRPRLERLGLTSVAACMEVAASGRLVSSDRQSAAVRLDGDEPLLLKWRRPRVGRRWRTTLRASRERLEARAALRAAARGIVLPLPLAVAERRARARLVGSVFVRAWWPAFEPADRALGTGGTDRLEGALAQALGRWHQTGFRHGDCYPKNVLVRAGGEDAAPIGFPRAAFRKPGGAIDRARLKDLAQWAIGLAAIRPGADPFAFLRAYAEAAGLPGPEWLAGAVRPLFDALRDRKRARLASQPRREPHGPPAPSPLGPDASAPPPRRDRPLADLTRGHPPAGE